MALSTRFFDLFWSSAQWSASEYLTFGETIFEKSMLKVPEVFSRSVGRTQRVGRLGLAGGNTSMTGNFFGVEGFELINILLGCLVARRSISSFMEDLPFSTL